MGTELSAKDHAVNAAQALLKGVPYIGASLDQFVFGPLQERRMRRIEATLGEVALALGPDGAMGLVQEQFVNLLEAIAPSLSRATDESKRVRFRDLLKNAGELPPQDPKWDEASLAAELLEELDSPALAILAAISRCNDSRSNKLTLTSRPVSQVFEGAFNYDEPGTPQHVLPYEWIVVEFWAQALKNRQLIWYSSSDVRGGFGGVGLAPRGEFLIRWTLCEPAA
jgi:hypothetical protein